MKDWKQVVGFMGKLDLCAIRKLWLKKYYSMLIKDSPLMVNAIIFSSQTETSSKTLLTG